MTRTPRSTSRPSTSTRRTLPRTPCSLISTGGKGGWRRPAEYEEAIRLSPELPEERVWIGRIRAMVDRKERGLPLHEKDQARDFACYSCGAIIPAEETHCPECGQFVGKG